jgi:tripartite-type tricarboxylate transporter receptor subunit TctC
MGRELCMEEIVMSNRIGLVPATAALALCAAQAVAQSAYPAKAVRMILPFPAGAVMDSTARALAPEVAKSMGQPVLIENRPGGSFIIGNLACAKSAPDGYTICMNTNSYNELVYSNLPYNPDTDFVPIIHLAWISSMLIASGNAPFNTFKEMISVAKAKPGSVNWGTWGNATTPDIYLRWINEQMGVKITAVPYKGGTQTMPAILAGEIQVTQFAVGASLPMIKAGKLKAIALLGDRRSPLLPDVPSLGEERANPAILSYFGLFAPANTPRAIVERLNAEFAKAMRTPSAQDFFRTATLEPIGGSAEDFARFLKADAANAARVFKIIGIHPTAAPQ